MRKQAYPPLSIGTRVQTIKPDKVSSDWEKEALKHRRWNVSGHVLKHSDSHGLIYEVEHADGTKGWYESRELKAIEANEYTPEERAEMLKKMHGLSDLFYSKATSAGVHAFIEFAGLMNEFIRVCEEAQSKGQDFPFANTHCNTVLPFKPHNLGYLAEKLNCIYGPALLSSAQNREAFIAGLFDGEYRLERNRSQAPKSAAADRAKLRPANFDQLSGEEQWEIDKDLGILDWDGS